MSNGYAASVMRDNMDNQAGLYCTPRPDVALLAEINAERAKLQMPPLVLPSEVSANVNQGIDATLDERGKRYGSYTEKAVIIQQMKESMRAGSSWAGMDADMKESLEMVVHKIGRIVTGDPEYLDSWTDVIGYTKLVEDRLKGVAR